MTLRFNLQRMIHSFIPSSVLLLRQNTFVQSSFIQTLWVGTGLFDILEMIKETAL